MINVKIILADLDKILESADENLINSTIRDINRVLLESDDETGNEELDSYLMILGTELDLYVSDPVMRSENRFYYGTEELKKKVKKAIDGIKKYGTN